MGTARRPPRCASGTSPTSPTRRRSGVDKGIFEKNLGSNKLETSTFKDGTEASEALEASAIDATYIGSGPAINLFQKSNGEAIRVVSGAASVGLRWW